MIISILLPESLAILLTISHVTVDYEANFVFP